MPMYTPASLQSASNLLFRREKKDEVAPSLSAAYRKRMQDDPRYGRVSSLEEGAMNHIPNSGWAGAIAQAFNGYLAGKERRDLEKDYTGQQESRKGMIAQLLANEPNLDPMVRQMAQDPEFGDMALMSVFKQKMDPKERPKMEYIDGPDGKYAVDPTDPNGTPRKVLDAKPEKLPGDVEEYKFAISQIPEGQAIPSYTDWTRANKKAGASNMSVTNMMPGEKKADENYAEDFVDWTAKGGYANTVKQIQQMRQAIGELKSSNNISGPVVGSLPDTVKAFVAPGAIATKERVAEVVQSGLRQVLGSQYTAQEGENFINRAFNDKLPEAENALRLERFLGSLEAAANAKQEAAMYFQQNGSLKGWEGPVPTMDDFYKAVENDPAKALAKKPGAASPYSKTATNPKTGERVGWDGNKWVPIQ